MATKYKDLVHKKFKDKIFLQELQMQDINQKSVQEALNTLEATQGANEAYSAEANNQAQYANQQSMEEEALARQQNYMNGNYAQQSAFNAQANQNAEGYDAEPVENQDDLAEHNLDLQAQVSELQGQLEAVKQQVVQERDKMLRAVAEADNIRKRAAQEVERERKFALEKFVRSLLPVYDALEKALEFSDKNNEAAKATIEGVETTLTLFLKEMSSFGVEIVDPTNQPFDPNFHQAISMVPSPEVPNNHVLSTMQKGFLLNGRVVRPAMVIVSKGA